MSASKEEVKAWIREVLDEKEKERSKHTHHQSRDEIIEGNANIVCSDGECYYHTVKKARETMPYKCSDCGLPIPESMIGSPKPCPNCSGESVEENPDMDMDVYERLKRAIK